MKAEDVDLAHYAEGMSHLYKSGLFTFLNEQARVRTVSPNSPNYAEQHIAEANRSRGMNEMISMFLLFKETYLSEVRPDNLSANYGGISRLLADKKITEEEANELRKQFR